MKKKMVRFVVFVCFLLAIFMYASCGGGVFLLTKTFDIELHDENNNIISKKEDLENFEVSQIDNHSGRKFDGKISLGKESKDKYCYGLFFYLGTGSLSITEQRYERKFKKQMENTGIRIVDKNGRYKTHEIYPLSNYNVEKHVNQIIVKLERK